MWLIDQCMFVHIWFVLTGLHCARMVGPKYVVDRISRTGWISLVKQLHELISYRRPYKVAPTALQSVNYNCRFVKGQAYLTGPAGG